MCLQQQKKFKERRNINYYMYYMLYKWAAVLAISETSWKEKVHAKTFQESLERLQIYKNNNDGFFLKTFFLQTQELSEIPM